MELMMEHIFLLNMKFIQELVCVFPSENLLYCLIIFLFSIDLAFLYFDYISKIFGSGINTFLKC